jgi:hypothetical protein
MYPPGFVDPIVGPRDVGVFVPPLIVAEPLIEEMVTVVAFSTFTVNGAVPSGVGSG